MSRSKFSYVDNRGTHIVTTDFKDGDNVVIRLSNLIVEMTSIYCLNSTVVDPYKCGLHFDGIIINDPEWNSKRNGETVKSIPFSSIEGVLQSKTKVFN